MGNYLSHIDTGFPHPTGLTLVHLLLAWNLSPLQSLKFLFECLLLPPRSAQGAVLVRLMPTSSLGPVCLSPRRGLALSPPRPTLPRLSKGAPTSPRARLADLPRPPCPEHFLCVGCSSSLEFLLLFACLQCLCSIALRTFTAYMSSVYSHLCIARYCRRARRW